MFREHWSKGTGDLENRDTFKEFCHKERDEIR